jgi:hypothetical protein
VVPVFSQDLTPRAYLITPVGSNAVTVNYSYFTGSVFTDPTVPITNFQAEFAIQTLSYYHSSSLFGRSANAVVALPYAFGRSGLADLRARFSLNLLGGPAMHPKEFFAWKERSVLGVSLTIVAPTGQYDPVKLINPGLNRWALKPELGFSKRWRRWSLDMYGGAWFSSANDRYFPGDSTRKQAPIEAVEFHWTYYLNPRFWASADVNYWLGGRTTLDGSRNFDYQRNSRVGGTIVLPVTPHQSLKLAYSGGARIAVGGNFHVVSMAWQYAWIGGKR